jgi:hypothetical protein
VRKKEEEEIEGEVGKLGQGEKKTCATALSSLREIFQAMESQEVCL